MRTRFEIGQPVRIKHLPQVMIVIAEPTPFEYHLFIGAGKTLFNVPAELLERGESADIVSLARAAGA